MPKLPNTQEKSAITTKLKWLGIIVNAPGISLPGLSSSLNIPKIHHLLQQNQDCPDCIVEKFTQRSQQHYWTKRNFRKSWRLNFESILSSLTNIGIHFKLSLDSSTNADILSQATNIILVTHKLYSTEGNLVFSLVSIFLHIIAI